MNSQIITGTVYHGRNWPEKHKFSYPIYFYRIDLDELPELDRNIPGFGYNRFSLIRINDKDFFWRSNQPLRVKINRVLENIYYSETIDRVELVGFAKFLNLTFRPVSFFVCYDSNNRCRLILSEVHNTFGETHLYVLKEPLGNSETLTFSIDKSFHVSPFFDLKGRYLTTYKDIGNNIDITIKLMKDEGGQAPVFFARLSGKGQTFKASTLYKTLLKYPFNAVLNLPRILRQAFTLYFKKKLPYHPKPVANSESTMRKKPPSWLCRQGMKVMFSFFKTQSSGIITVKLPDGEIQTFGSSDSSRSYNLQIHDYRLFSLLAKYDEIGLGIAYEKGYWESEDLVGFMNLIFVPSLTDKFRTPWYSFLLKSIYSVKRLKHKNTLAQAKKNISEHYDLSNEMYKLFLDETLTYSCAIFKCKDEALADAQRRKIDRMLEKACLSENHHLLEIGTGWGTLAIRAVERYGCRVTTITLSKEQHQLAQQRIAQAGLEDRIDVQLCDYREVSGQYDRIVSVEMIEAVGKAYLPSFFQCCDRLLKSNGLAVIQTITIPDQNYEAYSKSPDWINIFIFPGGLLPSLTTITKVLTNYTSFVIKQVESIGPHYALTLSQWRKRFLANKDKILKLGFSEIFIRRWEYYFSYCQAGFAQHYIDDLQIVLTRPGNSDLIEAFNTQTGGNEPIVETLK